MNVTLQQLKAFVAVAETGSFADASFLLHRSQPAISITIKNLEDEIGGKLFARTTRHLNLTPEGQAFLPVAHRLLADWDKALGDLHNHFSLKLGKLNIAAIPSFAGNQLPQILARYRALYPKINISIEDVITEDVVDMVLGGRVEIGVTFDPGPFENLEFHPLFEDRFIAVLPPAHPLLAQAEITWADLRSENYIALQKPSGVRLMVDGILEDHGLSLTPTLEAHQLVNIGAMVAGGLGVSVVPSLTRRQMGELGAECRAIAAPVIARSIGILTRKRAPLSVAANAMLQVLQEADFVI